MKVSNALPPQAATLFRRMDQVRRSRGKLLEVAGFAPVETAYRTVHEETGLRLRCYGGDGPALLIVPAPIKRPYIWDLLPQVSVVQKCLRHGLRVYLAEWTEHQENMGLDDYADRLLSVCLRAIASQTGEQGALLVAHSLGGVLATIFSGLHPERVRGLLLLEAPLHFDPQADQLAAMVAEVSAARQLARELGNVPGSLLSAASAAAAPEAFRWERHLDFFRSLNDREAWATYMRVERWTHDEFALPGRLFGDVVEQLYRGDELMQGRLRIGGSSIGPQQLTAPLVSVFDPRSRVIPAQAVKPFHEAAASKAKLLLHYEGDVGIAIQHVGVLVGRGAHQRLWPTIFGWLDTQGLLVKAA